jgi:hypothetical protein
VTAARWARPVEGALAALRRRRLRLSRPLSCGSGRARGRTSQRARPMGPRKAGSFRATSDRGRPAHRPARRAPVGPRFHQQGVRGPCQAQHCCPRPVLLPRTLRPSPSWAPRHAPAATRLPRWITKGPWAAPQLTPFPPCRRLEGCPRGRRPQGADGTPRAGDRCGEWDKVNRPSLHAVQSSRPVLRASAVTGSASGKAITWFVIHRDPRPGSLAAQHPRWLVLRRRKGQGSKPARYRCVEPCQHEPTARVLQRCAAWRAFGVRRDAAPGAHERAHPCVEGASRGVGLRVFVSLRGWCFAVDGRRRPRATRLWREALRTVQPVTRRITP